MPPTGPLDALDHLYARWSTPQVDGHPPLTGGLVGFIGWEAIRQLERLPDIPPADFAMPGQALELRVASSSCSTTATARRSLIASALNDGADAADALWAAGAGAARRAAARASRSPRRPGSPTSTSSVEPSPVPRVPAAEYRAAVERSKQYIRDGDVFQVVISQRFDHEIAAEPIDVYRVLRALNPSPYMYLLTLESARRASRTRSSARRPRRSSRCRTAGCTRIRSPARSRAARRPERDVELADELLARPEGAGRAPHARRPGPQRPLEGVRRRVRRGDRVHAGRAVQPHHAPGVERRGRPAAGCDARSTCSGPRSRPARCRARRSRGRWRSSTSSRSRSAASTAAWSGTSGSPATRTWPSRSAPPRSSAAWRACRPARAWSPTPTRRPSTPSRRTRPRRRCGRSRSPTRCGRLE